MLQEGMQSVIYLIAKKYIVRTKTHELKYIREPFSNNLKRLRNLELTKREK